MATLLLGRAKNKNMRPFCSDVGITGVVDANVDAISVVDPVGNMDTIGTVDAVGVVFSVNMLVRTINNDVRIGAAISKATRISTSQNLLWRMDCLTC